MRYPDQNFMVHFRWITPLLLFMLNIIVGMIVWSSKNMVSEIKTMRGDIVELKVNVATIKGRLGRSD